MASKSGSRNTQSRSSNQASTQQHYVRVPQLRQLERIQTQLGQMQTQIASLTASWGGTTSTQFRKGTASARSRATGASSSSPQN